MPDPKYDNPADEADASAQAEYRRQRASARRELTPIDRIAAALRAAGHEVDEILVPEQCLAVYLAGDDRATHVTCQPMPG